MKQLIPLGTDETILSINVAMKNNHVFDHMNKIKRRVDEIDLEETKLAKEKAPARQKELKESIELKCRQLGQDLAAQRKIEAEVQKQAAINRSFDSDVFEEPQNSDLEEQSRFKEEDEDTKG